MPMGETKKLPEKKPVAWHIIWTYARYANDTLYEKCPNTEFFLVCIFPHSGWIRRFTVNLRIQPEYGKIRTRKNSISGQFSSSDIIRDRLQISLMILREFKRINFYLPWNLLKPVDFPMISREIEVKYFV